ncbi:hypothetical protein OSTOST_07953, partial [Ostertagia ostertagi]
MTNDAIDLTVTVRSLIIVVKRYRFGEAGGSKVDERQGMVEVTTPEFNKVSGSATEHLRTQSRAALSPLKMNRPRFVKVGKLEDPITSTRKLNVGEAAMGVVAVPVSSGMQLEKENVAFVSSRDASNGTDSSLVKQSGGYLKENSSDAAKVPVLQGHSSSTEGQSVANSTTSPAARDHSASNVNASQISSKDDVPKKRSRVEDVIEIENSLGASSSNASTNSNESYARLITEPLRPSSRPSSSKAAEWLQSPEPISVLGAYEEKNTLFFRPVTEDCQKTWCSQLGFKYSGSPECVSPE